MTPGSSKIKSSLSLEELFNVSKIFNQNLDQHRDQFGEYEDDDINDKMELGDLLSQFNKNEFNAIKELIKQLENIFKEDEMLLEYFFKKINLSGDIDIGKTFLEGLYYE